MTDSIFGRYFCFSGNILKPKFELLFTWGLLSALILIFELTPIEFHTKYTTLTYVFLVGIPIEMTHVFSTFIPLIARKENNQISINKIIFISIITIFLVMLFYYLSYQVFITTLAFFAIFHIYRQHFGFFMVSRAKAKDNLPRIYDVIFSFNIMLFPLLWWLSEHKPFPQKYFHDNDFITGIPTYIVDFFHPLYLLLTIAFLVVNLISYRSGQKLNFYKLSLMLSTQAWLYLSIVLLANPNVFWSYLIVNHGLYYIGHTHQDYKRQRGNLVNENVIIPKFLFLALAFAICWYLSNNILIKANIDHQNFITSLIWTPLIIHYVFDFFIWKRKYTPIAKKDVLT